MRKLMVLGAAMVVASLVAVSVTNAAETQVNKYTVDGSIKGGKGATAKKPKPIQLKFSYTVDEEHGFRPSVITKYSIFFGNGQVNTTAFPGCAASIVSPTGAGPDACPKKSIMGSGFVHNATGATDDPTERNPGLLCNLKLTLVNSTKKDHFWLYLFGKKDNPDIEARCALPVNQAIDAKFTKTKKSGVKGTALAFSVPDLLVHPINGLDNSVILVGSTINKATAKQGKKTVGFFEATACPKKSPISVDFTQEAGGLIQTVKNTVKCS